jgi:hypothetical protein
MRLGVLLLLVAGCTSSNYPIGPGGGGIDGNGVGGGDGSVSGDIGGIVQQVCLVTDLRTPRTNCASTGVMGVTVTLGSETTMTTTPEGRFSLTPSQESGLVWHVSGPGLVPSVVSFVPNEYVLPVISTTTSEAMNAASLVTIESGHGSVFAQVHGATTDTPVSDVSIPATTPAAPEILFDGNNSVTWPGSGVTAAKAAVWVPDVAQGSISITFKPAGSATKKTVQDIPVEDGKNTYLLVRVQ